MRTAGNAVGDGGPQVKISDDVDREIPFELDKASLHLAARRLADQDPILNLALSVGGPPKLWKRSITFETFVRIILEQQVSLASAWATFQKLKGLAGVGVLTPKKLLEIGDSQLRQVGFSRQKSRYSIALAENCVAGRFKVRNLRLKSNQEVRSEIVAQLGMGQWTADVFLLMALCRRDIFPIGDLALVKSFRELVTDSAATPEQMKQHAERWRPFRSVAARMLWSYYLADRDSKIEL